MYVNRFAKKVTEEKISLNNVNSNATIRDVKREIEKIEGLQHESISFFFVIYEKRTLTPKQQRLFYRGMELKNEQRLDDYSN